MEISYWLPWVSSNINRGMECGNITKCDRNLLNSPLLPPVQIVSSIEDIRLSTEDNVCRDDSEIKGILEFKEFNFQSRAAVFGPF